ncbi:MAG: DegT/DnrJ/EryC1/StrS family aminotransferase [Gammaproteobacteria bacterium]
MKKIPLIKPFINQAIRDRVLEVLDSGFITEGRITRELEEAFIHYTGASYAIAFTSCTTGLETALRALDIGPGDEVIVPDFTYPATANVVNIVGATTVIVDINPETMLINYSDMEKAITSSTRATIPVSIFGNPLDYDQLNLIKGEYGIHIIEDAACSIGATFRGKRVGQLADISVFSMHPRKFITTGEGGMLTTDNNEWADWIESFKHFGIDITVSNNTAKFQIMGANYKLSDILSSIGVEQMRLIDELFRKRIGLAGHYRQLIEGIPSIKIPVTTPFGKHSYQSFCIFINNRDGVIKDMRKKGIEVQIGTYALHQHPAFSTQTNCRLHGDMNGSSYAAGHTLTLPLFHDLSHEDQIYIVQQLKKSIRDNQ